MKVRLSTQAAAKVRWIEAGLLAMGSGVLAYCGLVLADAYFYQAGKTRIFERALNLAKPLELPGDERTSDAAVAQADGAPVGRIRIARLRLSVIAVNGVTAGDLGRAAGHIPGTAYPGQRGNAGFAGHRDTFFQSLGNVRVGDRVEVTAPSGTFHYVVRWTAIVDPEEVWVLKPGIGQVLTLVTCYPFRYIGPAPRRFIVRAGLDPG